MAESTTANAPDNGTVDAAEVMASEEFRNRIMGMYEGKPFEEKQEPAKKEEAKVEEPVKEQEVVEDAKEEVKEEEAANQLEQPEKSDSIDKRLKDAQSFIGRQANELGTLRKQVADMMTKFEADRKQTGQESEPYYEKLMKASKEVIEEKIGQNLSPAEIMQFTARMVKDMMDDKLKPLDQMVQQTAQQKEFAKKDTEWYGSHPEHKDRQDAMKKFIESAYPEGLNGADPYVVAHMAYEYVGKAGATAQQSAQNQNDKRILNARSLSASAKGVVQQTKKQTVSDSKQAEIEKSWEQVAQHFQR